MREFLAGLVELSLTMGAVIALLLALGPVLNRRFPPQWRYWAWLVVALRLAVPFNVSFPDPPLVLEAPAWTVAAEAQPEQPVLPADREDPLTDVQPPVEHISTPVEPLPNAGTIQSTGQEPVPDPRPESAPQTAPAARPVDPLLVLTALWAVGAAGFLLVQFGGYLRFLRRVKRWQRFECTYEGLPVYRCAAVRAPVLAGLVRPRVLLPEGLSGEPMTFALLHEHTHFLRRDLWYKLLLVWVNGLFWFHPLVWLLRRSAERDLEISCDAQALRDMDLEYRQRYGTALLAFAAGTGRAAPLTSGFGGGMPGLRLRFRSLVDLAPKRAGRAALALVLCAAALGAGLAACQTTQEEPPGDGIYYSRDPVLEGDVLTFTPMTESGTRSTALSFPLAESVHLPLTYNRDTLQRTPTEGAAAVLAEMELRDTNQLWPCDETLMVTVAEGAVTALKWVMDPHLDGSDGVYYGCNLIWKDEVLTFDMVPILPFSWSISTLEEEWRQMSLPTVDELELNNGTLEPFDTGGYRIVPSDDEPIQPGQTTAAYLWVEDGMVSMVSWSNYFMEPKPLTDGTYYGLLVWYGVPNEEPVTSLSVYLAPEAPRTAEDWELMAFQCLPVAPARQEGLLDLLCTPLRDLDENGQRLLYMTVKKGQITDLEWTDHSYQTEAADSGGLVLSVKNGQYDRDCVIREIDLEQGTVTLTLDTLHTGTDSIWNTYPLAPGVTFQLWEDSSEGWVDASMQDLVHKLRYTSTWGVTCRVRMAGAWITAIREASPWGVPGVEDGTYYIGRRVRWGDAHWDASGEPIAAIEAVLYDLDPDTGKVTDNFGDLQLMVSRNVVCYNEDGSLWEGDLESFLETFNQDAQDLRQERKNYLTWPLNDILTLEITYESGLIRTLRRMPPPEL